MSRATAGRSRSCAMCICSSPTRNDNRADGTRAKDATYSMIDYLDPKATDAFLHIT